MSSNFFARQQAAIRKVFADVTNSDREQFTRDTLTITQRPEPAAWPFTAMVVGFGAGVVMCIEERYVDWAKQHAPKPHHRAFYLGFQLEAEARRRGESLNAGPPTLGWALGRRPRPMPVPDGYRLERVEREWMTGWQRRNVFHHALGNAEQLHRTYRNQYAFVLFDASDEPAAVAGVYDTAGLSEIGVDARRQHRGRGLAPVVVGAAARSILDERKTPFYECPVTNIRSQGTALASGFLPACSVALVYQAGLGLAET